MIESFSAVTPQGASIVELFLLALSPSALILAVVFGGMAFIPVRHRERAGDVEPAQIHGNGALEIGWTVAPLLVLAVFFGLTIRTMLIVDAEPGRPCASRSSAISGGGSFVTQTWGS